MAEVAERSSEFLSTAELRDLTGVVNILGQESALKRLGLPYRRRDNRVLVSRHHTREWLAGRVVTPSRGVNLDRVK